MSGDDTYQHSEWLTFMEDRFKVTKKLLNPKDSVLTCTIDEKEYLRLDLLLVQVFSAMQSRWLALRIIMPVWVVLMNLRE